MKTMLWVPGWAMTSEVWGDGPTRFLPEYEHVMIDFTNCTQPDDYAKLVRYTLVGEHNDQLAHSPIANPRSKWTIVAWSLGAVATLQTYFNLLDLHETDVTQTIERIVIVGGTLNFVDEDRQYGWPHRVVERLRRKVAASHEDRAMAIDSFIRSMFTNDELAKSLQSQSIVQLQQEAERWSAASLTAGLDLLITADIRTRWSQAAAQGQLDRVEWIHGRLDTVCSFAAISEHVQRAKPYRFATLPDAGHAPFITEPHLFYNTLRSLLHADIE